MSIESLPFSVIRYMVDLHRQEVVNVGVVLFSEGGPKVIVSPGQGKVLALNPNFPVHQVFDQTQRLADAVRSLWEDATSVDQVIRFFSSGGALSLTPPGRIERQNRSDSSLLEELLRELVAPPAKQRARTSKKSRLHTELRAIFREAKILGSSPEDITNHLVVPNYPIDADTGLFAEFALQNGRLHLTETIDFRLSTPSAKKQESQAKTLLLVEAHQRLGRERLQRYVVVSGASAEVQSSLNLLEKHADDLIVRESHSDWQRYVDLMHMAAKISPSLPRAV